MDLHVMGLLADGCDRARHEQVGVAATVREERA